jgi:hypothetical protein
MGADLTLIKAKNPAGGFEVSKKAVESGYFRDAYNSYGLFAVLSATLGKTYSWWQFDSEATEKGYFTKDRDLNQKGITELLKRVKEAKKAIAKYEHLSFEDYESEQLQNLSSENDKFTREHLDLLIEFLENALKLNSNINWSV